MTAKGAKIADHLNATGIITFALLAKTELSVILRGVRLIGIDSVEAKREKKIAAWEKVAGDFKIDNLDSLTTEISLEGIKEAYEALLAGKAVGRYLVKIS